MIPKIKFKYSEIYNRNFQEWIKVYKRDFGEYPSKSEIISFTKRAEKIWKKYESKTLKAISSIAGLKWQEEEIIVYVVGKCIPFSSPLTIHPFKTVQRFMDVLVHELIHQIIGQNFNKKQVRVFKNRIRNKYKKESEVTRRHILVFAIHSHVYLSIFGEKRLDRDIEISRKYPDYYNAWKIVKKEGHDNIICMINKRYH